MASAADSSWAEDGWEDVLSLSTIPMFDGEHEQKNLMSPSSSSLPTIPRTSIDGLGPTNNRNSNFSVPLSPSHDTSSDKNVRSVTPENQVTGDCGASLFWYNDGWNDALLNSPVSASRQDTTRSSSSSDSSIKKGSTVKRIATSRIRRNLFMHFGNSPSGMRTQSQGGEDKQFSTADLKLPRPFLSQPLLNNSIPSENTLVPLVTARQDGESKYDKGNQSQCIWSQETVIPTYVHDSSNKENTVSSNNCVPQSPSFDKEKYDDCLWCEDTVMPTLEKSDSSHQSEDSLDRVCSQDITLNFLLNEKCVKPSDENSNHSIWSLETLPATGELCANYSDDSLEQTSDILRTDDLEQKLNTSETDEFPGLSPVNSQPSDLSLSSPSCQNITLSNKNNQSNHSQTKSLVYEDHEENLSPPPQLNSRRGKIHCSESSSSPPPRANRRRVTQLSESSSHSSSPPPRANRRRVTQLSESSSQSSSPPPRANRRRVTELSESSSQSSSPPPRANRRRVTQLSESSSQSSSPPPRANRRRVTELSESSSQSSSPPPQINRRRITQLSESSSQSSSPPPRANRRRVTELSESSSQSSSPPPRANRRRITQLPESSSQSSSSPPPQFNTRRGMIQYSESSSQSSESASQSSSPPPQTNRRRITHVSESPFSPPRNENLRSSRWRRFIEYARYS